MNWDLVQAFLLIAEQGSLSRAAEASGVSQPTLGRRLSELETQLGVMLFERTARGLIPTEAARRLEEPAQRMRNAARQLSMALEHDRGSLAGSVRISAGHMMAAHLLPPAIEVLRRRFPEIELELVATDEVNDLLSREADIAVRHVTPTESRLIARQLGKIRVGAWAHRDYLERGPSAEATTPMDYDWIGLDRSPRLIKRFQEAGWQIERSFFRVRCDDPSIGWQLALAGCGVAFAPEFVAGTAPDMRPVLPEIASRDFPIWLVCHRELRHSPRIRAVFDVLEETLAPHCAAHRR